ncbi:MAG: hypothetical protein IKF59_09925 [Lachnospiraceae bacterium]|nr:hypothetical protein [Lachnospiraceae bacterium]
MNSNEAILLTAVIIIIITLAAALILNRKKDNESKGSRSGPPPSAGADASKEERETGKTVIKSEKPVEEKKKESGAGLLYIPPEFVTAAKKTAGGSADCMTSETDSLSGTGNEGRTEIRGVPGGHGNNSENVSAGISDTDTRSAGASPVNDHSQTDPTGASDGNTVLIYAYRGNTDKWVCPYCELENPDWTNVCQVCGEIRVRRN